MSRHRFLLVLLGFGAILFLAIGIIDVILRSYLNEASSEDREQGIHTKIEGYSSLRAMGVFQLPLFFALKEWSDGSSCLADPTQKIVGWADMEGSADIEVCLSRIFSDVATDEEIAATLTANGFAGSSVEFATTRLASAPITVSASCTKSNLPCALALENFWSFPLPVYGYVVTISRIGRQTVDVEIVELVE